MVASSERVTAAVKRSLGSFAVDGFPILILSGVYARISTLVSPGSTTTFLKLHHNSVENIFSLSRTILTAVGAVAPSTSILASQS